MNNIQQLSYLVWELRFLSTAAQTAHWRVFGPSAYSDHLLYGRIYEKLNDLLDPVAERLTALSQFDDAKYVCPLAQAQYVLRRTQEVMPVLSEALLDPDMTATFFYEQLLSLTYAMKDISSALKADALLSYGLDDLLASTANELEVLVFFLERRSQSLGH